VTEDQLAAEWFDWAADPGFIPIRISDADFERLVAQAAPLPSHPCECDACGHRFQRVGSSPVCPSCWYTAVKAA